MHPAISGRVLGSNPSWVTKREHTLSFLFYIKPSHPLSHVYALHSLFWKNWQTSINEPRFELPRASAQGVDFQHQQTGALAQHFAHSALSNIGNWIFNIAFWLFILSLWNKSPQYRCPFHKNELSPLWGTGRGLLFQPFRPITHYFFCQHPTAPVKMFVHPISGLKAGAI